MRRNDREITDKQAITQIIDSCDVCRLALSQNNTPYIVPLNFGYKFQEDSLVLYFHSAKEGTKLDIINQNKSACFEMDYAHEIVDGGDNACKYSMNYQSVIGFGEIAFCDTFDEKNEAMQLIMKKYVKDKDFVFNEQQLASVCLFKLNVNQFTGKSRTNPLTK